MLMLLFAALQVVPPVPAVVAPIATWTPATIGLLTGAATTVIAAISAAAVQIIREIRATKKEIVNNALVGAAAGEARDQKLNRIEVLVNGRYSAVLTELATMKDLLARMSGDPQDRLAATLARNVANDQLHRIAAVDVSVGAEAVQSPTPSSKGSKG